MTEFYVGQKVWSNGYGAGVVEEIYPGEAFPVGVKFYSGFGLSFTSDGRHYVEGDVVLFPCQTEDVRDDETTKPSIDWSQVKDEYKWLSVDANDCAYVSEIEPKLNGSACWQTPKGAYFKVNGLVSYSRGTCDWRDSLVKRPEGEAT